VPDTSTGVLRDEVDDSEHPGSNISVNLTGNFANLPIPIVEFGPAPSQCY